MVEWCKRIFENKLDWGHIIYTTEVGLVRIVEPFTLKNGELYKIVNHREWVKQ